MVDVLVVAMVVVRRKGKFLAVKSIVIFFLSS